MGTSASTIEVCRVPSDIARHLRISCLPAFREGSDGLHPFILRCVQVPDFDEYQSPSTPEDLIGRR